MIRKIIIPTWRGHFRNCAMLAESFNKYVHDKDTISLCFVASDEIETNELKSIIGGEFEITNLKTLMLDAGYTGGNDICSTKTINQKHPYQAIKKYVALWMIKYDQCLLMDSDSVFIKPTNLGDIFDEYFDDPFVFYSSIASMCRFNSNIGQLISGITENSIDIIGHNKDEELSIEEHGLWFFEYYGWFVDKKIFNSFVTHIENIHGKHPIDVMKYANNEFFEIIGYYFYIRRMGCGHRFLDFEKELEKFVGSNINNFYHTPSHMVGCEFLLYGVTEETSEAVCAFINHYKLRLLRLQNNFPRLSLSRSIAYKTNTNILASCTDSLDV